MTVAAWGMTPMKKELKTAKWHAELNTDVCDPYTNADLTIKLKLGFRQINPSGGAAEGKYHDYGDSTEKERKIIKWTKGAWAQWTEEFIKSVQKFWHGKFWLVNNFTVYEYDNKGTKYRPNLWCRFEVTQSFVPEIGPVDAHHVIDVVRLHSSENWFGSHSTLYDSRDTRWAHKNTDSKGNKIMQRAHVHEIGHLLGLGHVDEGKAHCPNTGDTNAAACYGISDIDMKNVMGGGMAITADLAKPWRDAACQISAKGAIGTLTDWESKLVRHYPRTLAEAISNKAITARPKR